MILMYNLNYAFDFIRILAGHFEDGSGNEDDDGDEDVQDETRASSKSPHTDVISKRKLDCVLGNGSKCGSGVVAAEEKRIKS